jgi:hypothetical protein
MTTDVAQKVITGNPVVNGGAVTGVDRSGNNHTVAPDISRGGDATALETDLTDRFDNPRYYTGDATS